MVDQRRHDADDVTLGLLHSGSKERHIAEQINAERSYRVGLRAEANFSAQTFKPAHKARAGQRAAPSVQSAAAAMQHLEQHLEQRSSNLAAVLDAAPRTAVRKRALPLASSLLSEQRRMWLIFAEQIEIFRVKAWLATFKARNANLKFLDDNVEKRKKKQQPDRPAEGVNTRLRRSVIDLLSLSHCRSFPNLSCLVSLNL